MTPGRRRIGRAPLVRSSLGLAAARAVSGLLFVIASVVVAREAGAAALGVFGLALTVGVYASTVADAGVAAWLLPELGRADRDEWPRVWAGVVRFELSSAAPFVALYSAAVLLLAHGPTRWVLLAAGPWWLLLRVNGAARSVFTVAERVGAEAVATTAESVVSVAAIAAVLTQSKSPSWAVLALSAGAAIGLAIRLRGLSRLGVTGGRAVEHVLRPALPFAGYTILTTLYLRIDVVLLSVLSSAHDLGLYQPAVRFAVGAIILPDALATVLLGRAARAPEGGQVKRRQEQLLAVGMPAGLLLVLSCALFGKAALGALYGHEFRQAWLALTLLAGTVPVSFVASVNGNALTARGLQRTRVLCLAVASVVAVGAGIPAIALWGYDGAAAVSLVNELVLLAAYAVALAVTSGRHALVVPRPHTA